MATDDRIKAALAVLRGLGGSHDSMPARIIAAVAEAEVHEVRRVALGLGLAVRLYGGDGYTVFAREG